MNFEEYWKDKYTISPPEPHEWSYIHTKNGWDARQAEIDELNRYIEFLSSELTVIQDRVKNGWI